MDGTTLWCCQEHAERAQFKAHRGKHEKPLRMPTESFDVNTKP